MILKICSFLQLDYQMKYMLLESYILLAWARYRKGKKFSEISPDLGCRMKETSFQLSDEEMKTVKVVSYAIHVASRYTFWESECLVKAIAGMKMLEKRGIESTMYLGVAKDEKGLSAHAWLRSGGFYVSGSEGMEKFTVVEKFAKFI
jgi:hypothetical protein